MTMKRTVEVKKDDWLWSITCPDCPMKQASDILGQRPPDCASGALTNLQGAVTISSCKHYTKESINANNGIVTLDCDCSFATAVKPSTPAP